MDHSSCRQLKGECTRTNNSPYVDQSPLSMRKIMYIQSLLLRATEEGSTRTNNSPYVDQSPLSMRRNMYIQSLPHQKQMLLKGLWPTLLEHYIPKHAPSITFQSVYQALHSKACTQHYIPKHAPSITLLHSKACTQHYIPKHVPSITFQSMHQQCLRIFL
jgi:hypothetical protein